MGISLASQFALVYQMRPLTAKTGVRVPLGSANDFRDLVGANAHNEGRCLLFVYYSI